MQPYITCLIWNTITLNCFFFFCAKTHQFKAPKIMTLVATPCSMIFIFYDYMLLLTFLLLFSRTFRLCFPHNEVIETVPWELIGEVNVSSSFTSIVVFSKHLSYHLSGGTLCGVGLERTDSCVMLLIARAHCEYSVDHNYRGLEKKWPLRKADG